jgi:spore coat polysaccharide biosynthesis protein SpsF
MRAARVGAIVQARIGSSRMPGKVLLRLAGRPTLSWLLERLDHATTLNAVGVATTDSVADDPVVAFCREIGVPAYRGSESDVAQRLLDAAELLELDGFVRVNGDSPLLDQALVDRGVSLFQRGGRDLVTNVFPRSFPRGQSIEVLRTSALRQALERLPGPADREHVTSGIYREPEGLTIENFTAGKEGVEPDGRDVRLVLDTPEDAQLIERVLRAMERPHWSYRWNEVLALARDQTVRG